MTTTHVKICPYCQTPIKPNAAMVVCPRCGIPHHPDCWLENGRCTTYGCRGVLSGHVPDVDITLPSDNADPGLTLLDGPSRTLPAECPAALHRWNWGAFMLAPWWTFAMRQLPWFVLSLLPGLNIVAACYLAFNGNKLAWKSRYWVSAEHFADTQRRWNFWGILCFVLALVAGVLFLLLPATH